MGYFKEAYHDVRFNFDHFIVDYKRKYYSLNQNPRVLRARVPNQPFTSLRTFEYCNAMPVDTPGEASIALDDDEDKENIPEEWIRTTDIDLFPSLMLALTNAQVKELQGGYCQNQSWIMLLLSIWKHSAWT